MSDRHIIPYVLLIAGLDGIVTFVISSPGQDRGWIPDPCDNHPGLPIPILSILPANKLYDMMLKIKLYDIVLGSK